MQRIDIYYIVYKILYLPSNKITTQIIEILFYSWNKNE
jgi:hypothetical protein